MIFSSVLGHHRETQMALNSWRDVLQLNYLRPVLFMVGFIFLRHFSGGPAIQVFVTQVFRRVRVQLDPKLCAVGLAIIMLVFAALSGWLMDKVGRRRVIISAVVHMGVSEAILGGYFFLDEDPELRILSQR